MQGEADSIASLLDSGTVNLMHLRKPDWHISELRNLISLVPERLHSRLKIHDHFQLLREFNLGGVHLNSRNPEAPASARASSKSIHSLDELMACKPQCYDYVTLSPIFDSISKPGYNSPFPKDLLLLRPFLEGRTVIALGGVTEERIPLLKEAGFAGCAMLGSLWQPKAQ